MLGNEALQIAFICKLEEMLPALLVVIAIMESLSLMRRHSVQPVHTLGEREIARVLPSHESRSKAWKRGRPFFLSHD